MATTMIVLLMQFVIATKAGYVNHVQGEVNVKVAQGAQAGSIIKTGADGYAEILLNPGSFLRVGENSEVTLESVDLTAIDLRVISGTATVEASGVSKKNPITVHTQTLATEIIDDGLYLFTDGKALVRTGKLRPADSKNVLKKGWQLAATDSGYQTAKVAKDTSDTPVEIWSRGRSQLIAMANVNTYNALRSSRSPMLLDCWLFVPAFGAFTYMPRYSYRSPYGERYYSVVQPYENNRYESGNTAGGSAASGNNAGGAAGGSSGGFGGGAMDRPSNREILIERKATVLEKPPGSN